MKDILAFYIRRVLYILFKLYDNYCLVKSKKLKSKSSQIHFISDFQKIKHYTFGISLFIIFILNLELMLKLECQSCRFTSCCRHEDYTIGLRYLVHQLHPFLVPERNRCVIYGNRLPIPMIFTISYPISDLPVCNLPISRNQEHSGSNDEFVIFDRVCYHFNYDPSDFQISDLP